MPFDVPLVVVLSMQKSIFFGLLSILSYGAGSALTALRIFGKWELPKHTELLVSAAAILLHTVTLYYLVETSAGQNLSFVNMACLITWIAALFVTTTLISLPLKNLLLFVHPVAIACIALALMFPQGRIIPTRLFPREMAHILLSILGNSLLLIAAIQALFVWFQERRIRQTPGSPLLQVLPPVQVMERLLFEFIKAGLVVLTLALASGLLSWRQHTPHAVFYKLGLSVAAWAVFATLLWGRKRFGWRGLKMAGWTLLGMATLGCAYFGSDYFP